MRKQNMYYDDLIIGNILQKQWSVKWLKRPRVYEVDRKLGGQNSPTQTTGLLIY
jgi:hypothetical protein